jgi:hypothetical protein
MRLQPALSPRSQANAGLRVSSDRPRARALLGRFSASMLVANTCMSRTAHNREPGGEQLVKVASKAERSVISVCVTSALFTWGFWPVYASANLAHVRGIGVL